MICINPISFRGDVRTLGHNRTFHKENKYDECKRDDRKNEESVEVSERRSLLFAQVGETLQCHLFRGDWITRLLKKNRVRLIKIRIYGRIQRIETFTESQTVELVAPFLKCLGERGADAATFVT